MTKLMGPLSVLRLRNKSQGKGIGKLRKEVIELCGEFCCFCEKQFSDKQLQLDHIVPVALMGKVFDSANLQLLCIRCHKKKTEYDHAIIAAAKRLGYLEGKNGGYILYLSPEELISFYESQLPVVKSARTLKDRWTTSEVHSQPYNPEYI